MKTKNKNTNSFEVKSLTINLIDKNKTMKFKKAYCFIENGKVVIDVVTK